jgi:hypothetical protein
MSYSEQSFQFHAASVEDIHRTIHKCFEKRNHHIDPLIRFHDPIDLIHPPLTTEEKERMKPLIAKLRELAMYSKLKLLLWKDLTPEEQAAHIAQMQKDHGSR